MPDAATTAPITSGAARLATADATATAAAPAANTRAAQPATNATAARVSDASKLTVALLYGGSSGERPISIKSSDCVRQALLPAGFTVIPIDTAQPRFIETLAQSGADVVFIALHGKGGEDGTVQGICEHLGLPYTGSGVLASALAMDKERTKVFYRVAGLKTPASVTLRKGEPHSIDQLLQAIGLPCVVKPVFDGSSLGVSIVREQGELTAALETGFAISDQLMLEAFVAGTEVTVAVLGNEQLQALPVIEIVPQSAFYDFEAKYAAGGSEHICPANLPDELLATCQQVAITAHRALGCRGVSRTDLIVDEKGVPWVIETNTIPGMTETSLLPHAAAAVGIKLDELYALLLELALE
ncbi:MAG: D-alanine--D-alanine ligase [Coriobacteriales bacterium]|jgi:D-alanine-D-alanine ligase|nr:D-alanine--D-alanine ligase [Coriobacteriales bacterium]